MTTGDTQVDTGALVIERVFEAPPEVVWRAWTEPEHLVRWWGPKDFTTPTCEIDLRVGGRYLMCMRFPDGNEIWSTGVYREIVPLERIVVTDAFCDPEGNIVPASHYGFEEELPLELLVTVTLEDLGGRTKMTLRHEGLAGEMAVGANQGWNESFDKLAAMLAEA